jgi:hypothetical protein
MRLLLLSMPLLLAAQSGDPQFDAIRAKVQRHETLTLDENDYAQTVIERRNQTNAARANAEYAKQHPPRESTGLIPLTELGTGVYKGEQGGLYPGGGNEPPKAHLDAGLKIAAGIRPLDAEGHPSVNGRIVFMTIGMSNTHQESRAFLKILRDEKGVNPKLTAVDGAEGAQTAALIANPGAKYWSLVKTRLADENVTPAQVQAIWLKEANPQPKEPFPVEAKKLAADTLADIHNLHDLFPNLKIVYLSSRIYGGWAVSPLNPEPHAYEGGFAVKWLIADQIAGKPELNYDSAKGRVAAPWIAWGPYLWADGLKPRKDGLIYMRDDLGPDGTHPAGARMKVGRLLINFLETDATSRPWFTAQ